MKVHFLHPLDDQQERVLTAALEAGVSWSSGEIKSELAGTEILVAGRPKSADLLRLPDLRMLIIPWTGLPEETKEVLENFPDLDVHNLHHNAAPTAEIAIGLLLAAAKQIIPFDRSLRKGNWLPRYENRDSILLSGKRALVIGSSSYRSVASILKHGLDQKPLGQPPIDNRTILHTNVRGSKYYH